MSHRLISISFSPNTQRDDIWLAARLLLSPWKWLQGDSRVQLENSFRETFRMSHAFAFESGRTCLYQLLRAKGIGAGDEVLLQAYTCVAVPAPICWTGARPVYVDCAERKFTMDADDLERKITPQSKAVIIQHTFGIPADMERLLEIARRHNLFVIEDCAHAVGSMYEGKSLGTFGDAAFFSFGRDKPFSSVFGGVVVTSDNVFAARLRSLFGESPSASRSWMIQQLLHPLIFAVALPCYTFFYLGKMILAMARRMRLLSRAVMPEERRGERPVFTGKKMPNALATLALHQWKKRDTYIAHRKKIAKIYQSYVGKNADEVSYLRYPLIVEDPSVILQAAKRKNILLGDWYSTVIAPAGTDAASVRYTTGTCPKAEYLAEHSLNLPTHINITTYDAERIVNFLQEYGRT